MALSVLLYKEENEVNIHLYLFHKFHFEDQIIADVFLVLLLMDYLLTYIQIDTGIVLHISLSEQVIALELVKDAEQVAHLQNVSKQLDKVPFSLFAKWHFARL